MRSLSRLNKYFFRYKFRLLLGVLFVTVSNLFGIMPAKLIREAIDSTSRDIELYRLTKGWEAADTLTETISYNLLVFAGLVLLMALLKGLFMFLMRQTIIIVSRYIEFDLKNEIYDHYQKLDFNFYNRNSTGDLMNRISEDVGRVRMYVGPALMYTVNLVVMFVLVIYAMVQVDLKLTLITLLPLPLLSVLIYKVEDIINKRSELVQRKLSEVSTMAQESFSGIRVLKAYAMEKPASDKFGNLAGEYAEASVGLVKVNAVFLPSLVMLVGLSTILTVYFGGLEVTRGKLTLGNVAEFILYVNMLTWPVASLGWVVSLVQRAAASQERLNEFLDTEPAVQPGEKRVNALEGSVEFRNVTYRYPGAMVNTVENISFTINPGSSVAITGKTGSGKSTMAALLTRTFDPDQGEILIDGVPLKQYNTGSLNSRIGVVPQESFLFSDSIENNIAFGAPGAYRGQPEMKKKIELAASRASVLSNIQEFPAGMQTKVGERGITLSGGQKQRICIARALMHEPDLLVLDDCLSAVDTGTEESIIRNIRDLMRGKTTFWISHRISSISHADLILVMDHGKIVESGTHDALVRRGGLYHDLYNQQAAENQPDRHE